jgi:hypothetical protein
MGSASLSGTVRGSEGERVRGFGPKEKGPPGCRSLLRLERQKAVGYERWVR